MTNSAYPRRRFRPRLSGALNHFEQEIVKAVRGMSASGQAEVQRMIVRFKQSGGGPRRSNGRTADSTADGRFAGVRVDPKGNPETGLLERFGEGVHCCNDLAFLSRLGTQMRAIIETGRPLRTLESDPERRPSARTLREARQCMIRLAPRFHREFVQRLAERIEHHNSEAV